MTQITVQDLYTFMGRELEVMEEIPAGNILGSLLHGLFNSLQEFPPLYYIFSSLIVNHNDKPECLQHL